MITNNSIIYDKLWYNTFGDIMYKYFKDLPYKVVNAPKNYQQAFKTYQQTTYPYVMWFVDSLKQMKAAIYQAIDLLEDDGILYICYPKLKNTLNIPGIHRDHIFPYLQVSEATGYVDQTLMRFNKMASFDTDYTLLGIKKDIKKLKRNTDTTDYKTYIEPLKTHLSKQALAFYNTLPRGYQTNWARYVFSAKQEATKAKRLKETIDLLESHVKTK